MLKEGLTIAIEDILSVLKSFYSVVKTAERNIRFAFLTDDSHDLSPSAFLEVKAVERKEEQTRNGFPFQSLIPRRFAHDGPR